MPPNILYIKNIAIHNNLKALNALTATGLVPCGG